MEMVAVVEMHPYQDLIYNTNLDYLPSSILNLPLNCSAWCQLNSINVNLRSRCSWKAFECLEQSPRKLLFKDLWDDMASFWKIGTLFLLFPIIFYFKVWDTLSFMDLSEIFNSFLEMLKCKFFPCAMYSVSPI